MAGSGPQGALGALHAQLKGNLERSPHALVTGLLLMAAAALAALALLPGYWLLKVIVLLYILLP